MHASGAQGADRPFVFGEGRISGWLSALLGACALLGVLCFRYPEYLTTAELRGALYSTAFARHLLLAGLAAGFVLGILSQLLGRAGRAPAWAGISSAFVAVLLGGASVEPGEIRGHGIALGVDWFVLSLLASLLIFIPLEKAFAQKPLAVLRPEWRTDLAYFFVGHLLIQFYLLLTNTVAHDLFAWAHSDVLKSAVAAQPFWLQFLAAMALADSCQYAVHRAYHRLPWLWRVHAIHHSARHLDWLAGSRMHLLEVLITRTAVIVPLYLAGFAEAVLNAYVVLVGVQAVLAHANVNWDFGALRYVLVTPQYHHWHHARDPAYMDANYAVHLPVIDMLFGTFRLPGKAWPAEYGVLGPGVPPGFFRQLADPFRRGAGVTRSAAGAPVPRD
jgi:sterol desaturase/sphingolipid hydroxylase (fatty acid hydroxylase superfamily)